MDVKDRIRVEEFLQLKRQIRGPLFPGEIDL